MEDRFRSGDGCGIRGYAVQELQRKLQEKNKALEPLVERGSAALQQQEQELNRAREIRTDLLPRMLPQLPDVELAILEARTRTLTYENAGHCAGLLMKNSGETEQLRAQGGVLGVRPESTACSFFTDSVTESENTKEEEFGYQGIANAAGTRPSSPAELKNKIMKAVEEFCHGEFRDDVTLVVACIR